MKIELKNKSNFYLKLLILTFLVLEMLACYYAYYTLGEVKQFLCVLILCLNIVPFVLYLFKLKKVSFIIALIIGLVLVPYQIFLLVQWSDLKKESITIVEYIYDYQKEKGAFPKNISDYKFENKKLVGNFSYRINSKGFGLHYYIGTKGTTHFYYHNVGKWEYYPD